MGAGLTQFILVLATAATGRPSYILIDEPELSLRPSLQLEAAITQTVSRTLLEEVTFDRSNVTSTDWRTYPILTFMDALVIETILIDRPELPIL